SHGETVPDPGAPAAPTAQATRGEGTLLGADAARVPEEGRADGPGCRHHYRRAAELGLCLLTGRQGKTEIALPRLHSSVGGRGVPGEEARRPADQEAVPPRAVLPRRRLPGPGAGPRRGGRRQGQGDVLVRRLEGSEGGPDHRRNPGRRALTPPGE